MGTLAKSEGSSQFAKTKTTFRNRKTSLFRKIHTLALKIQNGQSYTYCSLLYQYVWENPSQYKRGQWLSGRVLDSVECLTRDQGAAGLSLSGVTALCS